MRIVLDAHGGDVGIARNVTAAIQTLDDPGITLILAGHRKQIEAELRRRSIAVDRFVIAHADEQIGMDESAVQAVRRKTDNSISVGMELVRRGEADAFVSAGHSGAVVASALLSLGRIPGVSRPALGTRIPATGKKIAFVLDIGAVVDPKPEMLLQFGYLGAAYVSAVLGVDNPTVALLSNGEEPTKGNALVRAARGLFESSDLNFIGYVEGREMLSNPPNVAVTDGFTGNIGLKIAEGTASGLSALIRRELTARWHTKIMAALLRPTFRRIRDEMDFEGIGGAPLLGVNGVVIVAHGRSTPRALVNAIRTARHAADVDLPALVRGSIPQQAADALELEQTSEAQVPVAD